jgi:hypothetical protein
MIAPPRGKPVGPGKIFYYARTLLKKFLRESAGKFFKKIKIYFSNVFSMENDFQDHSASVKFFPDPVQEPKDSRQVSPPPIYVIAPSKNPPILQCRSGLPLEPVTGNTCTDRLTRHGSDDPTWRTRNLTTTVADSEFRSSKTALPFIPA